MDSASLSNFRIFIIPILFIHDFLKWLPGDRRMTGMGMARGYRGNEVP